MNIKVTDLRVGNKVYGIRNANLKEIVEVGKILWDEIITSIDNGARCFNIKDEIEGIPLSSDILEKCGKKYSRNDQNWEYEINIGALRWYFRWNTEWYSEIGGIYLGANVQYLHQVQNIYFDLMGHELTVNL